MRTLIIAILLSVSPARVEASARCTMMRAQDSYTRPANAPVLILDASADSILDAEYVMSRDGLSRVAPGSVRFAKPVYGQVFRLKSISGPDSALVGANKRVVVIWWSVAPSCTPYFPFRSVRVPRGEAFVLSRVRPQSEWVGGLPTFDVQSHDWIYVPSESRFDSSLSVSEYQTMFALLSTSQSRTEENRRAWQRLFAWAETNPRLAAKYPAFETLCVTHIFNGTGDQSCLRNR